VVVVNANSAIFQPYHGENKLIFRHHFIKKCGNLTIAMLFAETLLSLVININQVT
jgi:hypothetical protein